MPDLADRTQPGVSQRNDRGGTSVVRGGLGGPTRVKQPHPRRQRRWDVNDPFTGGDELLREQRAETAGGFDRPRPWLERCREPQQPVALSTIRSDAQLADQFLGVVEHRGGVGPLVWVDSNHEHHFLLQPDRPGDATAGSPDEG